MTSFNIEDAVAFVTGTNKPNGIGRAVVHSLLEHGAKKVYATARNTDQLVDLVAQYGENRIIPVALDVTDIDAIQKLPTSYADVTMVVNNAGYFGATSSLDDIAVAQQEMQINYFAPLAIVKAFSDTLQQHSEDGKNVAVVNVNSIASYVNFPLGGTYSASKAATHSLTQAQRRDLKFASVVGVYPGPIDTDMAEDVPFDKTPPSAVAQAIVDALKNGDDDVFPDAMAQEMHQGWKADAKAMEAQMTAMVSQSA